MRIKVIFLLLMSFFMLNSCEISDSESETNSNTDLLDIDVETVSTQNSITLKWIPVEGCSWYFISHGQVGEQMTEGSGYQDVYSDTLSYNLRELQVNTEYQIKIEGKDYLSGGKLLATKTLTASTNP